MFWIWVLGGAALAADADVVALPSGPRSVQIDIFLYDPENAVFGSDWKVTALEQWTAVLVCEHTAPRVERCTFPEGLWWSVIVGGETQRTSVKLPPMGAVEFVWNARGKLASWDVTGEEREKFWHAASNTQLQLTYRRPDVVFKPDGVREIGAAIERGLVRQLAGPLELELPKEGIGAGWAPRSTPWIGRYFLMSTSLPAMTYTVARQDERAIDLQVAGKVTEAGATGTVQFGNLNVVTDLSGTLHFDRAAGVTEARVHTYSRSSQPGMLPGHRQTYTVVRPWTGGEMMPATEELPTE